VAQKIDKRLISTVGQGEAPRHLPFDTVSTESDQVAELIREEHERGRPYRDFAVLVRANNDADHYLRALNMRGIPWTFSGNAGLYGRPTVVNNVETICNVPHILAHGADWYRKLGPNEKSAGPKIFCLSGWVNRPGNYELPLGALTFRELIEQHGLGMRDGARIKGVLPAGISAPIVPADKLDTKLDYESVAAAGSMLGSASLIVIPEDVSIVRAAVRMLEFFRHESCGKCTPCREGTMWLHKILLRLEQGRGEPQDLDLLVSLCGQISGKVLCALGDFATSPVTATIKHYRPEFLRAIERGADGTPPGARDAQGTSDWSRRG